MWSSYIKHLQLICLFSFLVACQNADVLEKENNHRSTLDELAQSQQISEINSATIPIEQRKQKLAQLYQAILSLEPNSEVRAKITYRLVQIDTQLYEQLDDETVENLQLSEGKDSTELSSERLTALVASYQNILSQYPNRKENEHIHYQLAKALALQSKLNESLLQMELLLQLFPQSQYAAELHFRRGDIYYNLQYYSKALAAYQAVLNSENHQDYYINSMYMSAWSLFKLNQLPSADQRFLTLLDYLVAQEKIQPYEDGFSFDSLNRQNQDLFSDIQRVLSISFSQQAQSESLVTLLSKQTESSRLKFLYLYRHILFKNLANFLIENGLKHDAELTYIAYLTLAPSSLWASRFSLDLLSLYQEQGKHSQARLLKAQYVENYGINSQFWQQGINAKANSMVTEDTLNQEVLPNLLAFSYEHSRSLYAKAQKIPTGKVREQAFSDTAKWLSTYLAIAKLENAAPLIAKLPLSNGIVADELLFADASFEAKQFQQALKSYQSIAYEHSQAKEKQNSEIYLNAAYATTVTVRAMLSQLADSIASDSAIEQKSQLLTIRNQVDHDFIQHYPHDQRAKEIAIQAAQYAFNLSNYESLYFYTDFIFKAYSISVDTNSFEQSDFERGLANNAGIKLGKLATLEENQTRQKQLQIASQLAANGLYRQALYQKAEHAYSLALQFVADNSELRQEMRNLLASSIYFQAQDIKEHSPLLAVEHLLRLGKRIPESNYRENAEFEAANILVAQKKWQQAVKVLIVFKQNYPTHEYTKSIAAKLVNAYEHLEQWQLAADQLVIMINNQTNKELKREAQYTAAEYYQKSGNLKQAISTFRTYAHSYPEPFDVAQEVRYKMSEFYVQTKEPNKQYYWYRKLISFHEQATKKQNVNARSTYLASIAVLGLGEAHQQTFSRIKLKLPLKNSLKQKQQSMKKAIHYYQKLLSYQREEFVPQGTFNLAQMYLQLADDVLSSQRPTDLDELALEEYELIIEEIAYPFEEKAIEIHTSNAKRTWQNTYDSWVQKSFNKLAELVPSQFNKQEREIHAVHALH